MRKLIAFIRSVYVAVLFVILEVLAVSYYAHSSSYTQARLLARSNQVIGGVHGFFAGVRRYLFLGRENRDLAQRVALLEEQLAQYREAETAERLDSYVRNLGESRYRFTTAVVVGNTLNRAQNLLTLNRGLLNGVEEEMAVLAPDGALVGYVVACTDRYSVAMSVLNTSFRTSGRIADSEYSGSIYWDGTDPNTVPTSSSDGSKAPNSTKPKRHTPSACGSPPKCPASTRSSSSPTATATRSGNSKRANRSNNIPV